MTAGYQVTGLMGTSWDMVREKADFLAGTPATGGSEGGLAPWLHVDSTAAERGNFGAQVATSIPPRS